MKVISKKIVLFIFIVVFMAISFNGGTFFAQAEDDVDDIKDDMSKLQNKIEKEEKELQQNQSELNVTQKQISTTTQQLNQTKEEISRKEKEIENLENRIELNKKVMMAYAQEMYSEDAEIFWTLGLSNIKFNEYFENFDQMLNVKEKFLAVAEEIKKDKSKTVVVKEELAEKKEEHEELLAIKQAEKKEIVSDIVETQATIEELQKKLAELQSDLLKVTGTSYSAKNIQEAVEYASGKTGVPKGVLYGFLKMETNLGANTGQCTYKKVVEVALARYKSLLKKNKKWQSSIDLLNKREDLFYDIVKDLGYSKDKKVSCSPSGYIGQGGAMGVSQFMSDVWKGYESQITANTGHKKPDPWNITDGVMAMAIKLKKAGATSDSSSTIKKASINYLGTFNNNYYSGIVYWAKNYKNLFK
ncbi:MAG: lytic murein transglycosylase [Candidatus Moraniibacteriota bacterium]